MFAIIVGVTVALVMFASIVGMAVVLAMVAFTLELFTALFTAFFSASVKSTQFGEFQSLPQLDQGSVDVNDANI